MESFLGRGLNCPLIGHTPGQNDDEPKKRHESEYPGVIDHLETCVMKRDQLGATPVLEQNTILVIEPQPCMTIQAVSNNQRPRAIGR